MRKNTHLPSRDYLEPEDLGETLLEEMDELAADALDVEAEHVEVSLFCRKGAEGGDDCYGYEILIRGEHRRVDDEFASILAAIESFEEWCEQRLGDSQDAAADADED
jgi:hypothetical protein